MQRFIGDRGWLTYLPHIFEHRYLQDPTINIPTFATVGMLTWMTPIGRSASDGSAFGLWLEVGAASRIVIGDVASSRV